MAKPIKTTPDLRGKDAVEFFGSLESNRNKNVSKAYLSEIRENAKQLRSLFRSR